MLGWLCWTSGRGKGRLHQTISIHNHQTKNLEAPGHTQDVQETYKAIYSSYSACGSQSATESSYRGYVTTLGKMPGVARYLLFAALFDEGFK